MHVPSLPSRIESLTVFRGAAAVTRVAELEAVAGTFAERVRLDHLPLSLDDDSLRARIESFEPGSGEGLPVASDLRLALAIPPIDDTLPAADDEELRLARRRERELRSQLRAGQQQRERLATLAPSARPPGRRGEPPLASPVASRLALLEFQRREDARLIEDIQRLERDLREAEQLRRDLEEKERHRSNARQARQHELRKSVVVSLRSPDGAAARSARLVIEYLVPGARWLPCYGLSLDSTLESGELAMRALVCQATGEDWSDVALTLSTAEPTRWTDLPELTSLRIGRRQPPPRRSGWRQPPTGAAELYADYDRARRSTPPPPTAPSPGASPRRGFVDAERAAQILGVDAAGLRRLIADGELRPNTVEGRTLFGRKHVNRLANRLGPRPCPAAAAPAPDVEIQAGLYDLAEAGGGGDLDETLYVAEPDAPYDFVGAPPPPEPTSPAAVMSDLYQDAAPPAPVYAAAAESLAEPELPTALGVRDEMLRYGSLRMPGPDESVRGSLQPSTAIERYLATAISIRVKVGVEVDVLLLEAARRADEVAHLSPPPQHRVPGSQLHFDYSYPARSKLSLPSDGQFHCLQILSESLQTRSEHVCVPRESEDAFRSIELDNPLDVALPPGPVDVSVGGEFLLTTPLDGLAPGGKARLGLGVDEGIKVARNTRYREATAGLMRGTRRFEHEIRIELVSHLSAPVRVEVRERVPVAVEGDDDVVVKLGEVTPGWQPFAPEDQPTLKGAYRWQTELVPGDPKTLSASYAIEIPSKLELVGGNRREG